MLHQATLREELRNDDRDELGLAPRQSPYLFKHGLGRTEVRVENLENRRDVVVRINDRGPFKKRRIIDLSYRAARELGFERAGTARVRVEVVSS